MELIRSLVPLGLMHVEEVLDAEVTALAGERYARKDASMGGRRHGSNPGPVGLAGQRVPMRVPRLRRVAGSEIPLRSYAALHGEGAVNDLLLKRVRYGISCRNYEAAAEAIPGAIGLSGSTVSRGFIEASAAKLRELQERDLAGEDVVAMVLDGKTFADATMVIALGMTTSGEKRFLGFVETDTENAQVLTPFLRSLVERGLDVSQGVLVILDGGKGLRSAVRKAFRNRALVQRCQWHTRENVVRYLANREQASWRQRLHRAYNRPAYDEALPRARDAPSRAGGPEPICGRESGGRAGRDPDAASPRAVRGAGPVAEDDERSINALVEERCAKVDHWQNSSQRHRWLATALLDIIQPHVWASVKWNERTGILLDVVRNTLCTHGHPRAFVGAGFHALSLSHVLINGEPSHPGEWRSLLAELSAISDLLERESELRTVWLPLWEKEAKRPFHDALQEAIDEVGRDIDTVERILGEKDRVQSEHYCTVADQLGCREEAQRGSATKTALMANVLASLFAKEPERGLGVAANYLGSDTDSIATMAGAILGAVADAAPTGEIADRAYISSDAARLAAIHEDRRIAGFSYPDLLHWSPPLTPLNCVGVDDSAHLALAGLGQVEPSGKLFPHHDRGSGWQWLVLKFGQRVLARRREHPQPLVSSLLAETRPREDREQQRRQ